jgi:hypothetical protein
MLEQLEKLSCRSSKRLRAWGRRRRSRRRRRRWK